MIIGVNSKAFRISLTINCALLLGLFHVIMINNQKNLLEKNKKRQRSGIFLIVDQD
jgi:hypothetical protein